MIEVFDLKKHRASYFAPPGEGRLRVPINLAIDTDGTRYVADTGREQVLIFSADGIFKFIAACEPRTRKMLTALHPFKDGSSLDRPGVVTD